MILKVKPLTGKEYNIEIETTDTIETIKQKINEQESIPIDQQRLTFRGKPLKDSKTIDSYQLKNGNILHMVKALRSH
ncbi:ubiquitin-like protein NEDD8 [Rhynchophorus ferrugineus]|uniref:ubiquitin-like protein NEDD8 n=1 Tax=Rhynchophorus ferrugineus TaxID=354439 RepID=UPI003FCCE417